MLESGVIFNLKDGIGSVHGLSEVAFGELVISGSNAGIVLNLADESVSVAFFTEKELKVEDIVFRTKTLPSMPINSYVFGSALNFLGQLESELSLSEGTYVLLSQIFSTLLVIDIKAPGIIERQSVYETLPTGVRIIDSLIPIGLGQRELIIGDRKTGKTAIALDMVVNQLRGSLLFKE
jgi:F-type H+-transporting ATPase subunit alpha